MIEAVSVSGNFIVAFDGYESKEEVQPGSVRPRVEVQEEGSYKGECGSEPGGGHNGKCKV